jgi:hypothetical protein
MRAKTLGESKCGTHMLSIEPSMLTHAADWGETGQRGTHHEVADEGIVLLSAELGLVGAGEGREKGKGRRGGGAEGRPTAMEEMRRPAVSYCSAGRWQDMLNA